jgi:4,5-DOPA dioxygenase extradiol
LRAQGILVIGSGFMTHGLPYLTPDMFYGNQVPGWSAEFDAWAAAALADRDIDELSAFRSNAPGMPYSHPTVEHFTPLFVTLGAASGSIETTIDGYAFGLSKRSLQVV